MDGASIAATLTGVEVSLISFSVDPATAAVLFSGAG